MKQMAIQTIVKPLACNGKGWNYETEKREVELMVKSGRYAMVRRKGCIPYVCLVKDLMEIKA